MSHPQVKGVVILARNGDRTEFYQDPRTYKPGNTETTPLGAVQSHQLGTFLRSVYLNEDSPSYIRGIRTQLADIHQVHVRAKAGGEGPVVFDSSIALLQGLFPPTSANKMVLANETTVLAPLGGYQYIPVETVEPNNDRSLESWTDCPAFQEHIKEFYASSDFKDAAKDAEPFLGEVKDFLFNTPASMENAWNVYDFMNSQLMHNRSYAHRLPPTYIEQARALADFHESGVFSDKDLNGIGNIVARTLMPTILQSLNQLAFAGNPLQMFVQEVSYQPIISLMNQLEVTKLHPELKAIPNYGSALAIELRKGDEGDSRDYLRFQFKNGTASSEFETVHIFGHRGDIAVTEFFYRLEGSIIPDNKAWASVCKASSFRAQSKQAQFGFSGLLVLFVLLCSFLVARFRRSRRQGYIRIGGQEDLPTVQHAGQAPVVVGEKIRVV